MIPAKSSVLLGVSVNNKLEAVKMLLDSGAEVNGTNAAGVTALLAAAAQGHVEVARTLLEHGADPNVKTTRVFTSKGKVVFPSTTPLFVAVYKGNDEIATLLLSKGAVDANGTAMYAAKKKDNNKMIQLIKASNDRH